MKNFTLFTKKNAKSLFIMAFLVSVCVFIEGCGSDGPIIPEVTIPNGSVNYFSEAIDFPASGGSKIVNFSSNVDWKIEVSKTQSNVTWCKISQTEGTAGSYGIAIIVDKNTGFDDRNVVLTLTAGNVVKSIIINQKQKNAITITTNRYEVSAEGGMIDMEIKANVDYKIEIAEDCKSWINQN